jgi:multisubunit Na+/H+ antiporter MnhB subunit
MAVFVGGLLCCLLGQGSNPDDEDEWFVHWFLWTLYDIAGSMVNETLVNIPTGDTLVDIFKNIMAIVPAMEQFKQSVLNLDDSFTFIQALLGFDD